MRRGRWAVAALTAVIACALGACSGSAGPGTATTSAPLSQHPVPVVTRATSTPPASPPPKSVQLPRGGTRIIGHYRVVAYYGAPGSGALGVLGVGSPAQAARNVIAHAKHFARFGLPVQPAMELIATVAQGSPGPDGDYSNPIPLAQIKRYLAVAHRYKMLLLLDLQPGRASFLSQAKALRSVLLDPSVGLGLDPEWKVEHGAPGGGRIGSTSAADVNAVSSWLSALVRAHHLPDKLEIVHQFTLSMIKHRSAVHLFPGVEVAFHADGFGSPGVKRAVYHQLHFPGHPFGSGFKLFFTQDSHLMRPAQVLKLHPRPDVITYQ